MKAKEIILFSLILFFLFPLARADSEINQTNYTNDFSYVPSEDYVVVELYAVSSEYEIWCINMTRINFLNGIANCNYDETERICRCRMELPPDEAPSRFIAVQQVEKRFEAENTRLKNELGFWRGLFWFFLIVLTVSFFAFKILSTSFEKSLILPKG